MDVAAILHAPETLGPVALSVRVLAAACFLHVILGVPIAYYLSRKPSLARDVVDVLVTLPMVFPPIATGFVLLMLTGRDGPLGAVTGGTLVFSFAGVVLAAFVAGLPLMVKPVQTALSGDLARLAEVSAVLGKSDLETFFLVLLPNIKRGIAAGVLLSAGRSLGEVGITLMLGGNVIGKTNTLSLEIYNAVMGGEFDRALVLSVIIGAASAVLFLGMKRWSAL